MEHQLVAEIEKAFGWSGPGNIGREFSIGTVPNRELCSKILTPERLLDIVMRRSLAPHRLQCLVDSSFLHPHDYITNSIAHRGNASPMADMHRLGDLLESGCTLVVDELNTYDPTMEVACRALQWWAREIVQVNTYLTTGQASGFKLHWDSHDVIIVQLAGQKSWEVRGSSRPVPMYRDAVPNPDPPDEIVWAGTMKVGDVMHIPRGYWHQATRTDHGDGFSLHATFGMTKRTGVDWFEWLADHARQHEEFRHDVNRWDSLEAQTDQGRGFVKLAERVIGETTCADFLAEREGQRRPARHVDTRGVFGKPADIVCVAEFPPNLDYDGDEVTVSACGASITFAETALPALLPMLSGTPVNIVGIAESTGLDAKSLADVLISEDVCAEVTPDLASGYRGLVTQAQRSA